MDLASPATATPAPAFAEDLSSHDARPSVISVERLRHSPAEPLATLVMDSETQGVRFVRRLVDEWVTGVNRFDQPGEALFFARRASTVVGVCGLNVDPHVETDGERRVGRVRHLYVVSTHRRLGIGDRLLGEVLAAARGVFELVRLRTGNPAAAALYERRGFRPTGGDPHCTHIIAVDGSTGGAMRFLT